MWHGLRNDIIMRNVIYGNGAKKYAHTRVSAARFCGRRFFWHKFEGATALLAQTNNADQHVGVNFSEFLIKGKEISSSQRGIQVSVFELTE